LKGTLEVTDLFRGAYLLASGGNLAGVRVRRNGRKIATFLITGRDLDRLDSDYRCGRALVNPVQLRESLNHLRDVMFSKLRDPASRKGYAGTRERARYDDREREDRGRQTWR
jgi:hypothetical protein